MYVCICECQDVFDLLSGLTLELVVAVESPTDDNITCSTEGMAPREGNEGELQTREGSYEGPSLFVFHISSNTSFLYT